MTSLGNDPTNVSSQNKRGSKRRGSGRPTIADVAALAQVATTSVSRALRNPELVSEKMRARITDAVEQLGYAPDPNARALASSRADVIGVLVPSFTNSVFTDVIVGLYDELGDSHLQIQLANSHYSILEEERLLKMFNNQRPTAMIVAGIDQSETSRRLLEEAKCPIVQIMEMAADPVDMLVGFSHFDGGKTATEHLIAAGYQNIAFIGARMDPRSQRRMAGYRYAMEAANIFKPELLTTTPQNSSIPLGSQLLGDALLKMPTLDAVFCNNDDLALGVLFESQRRGISVPHQLGICGFNDLDMMQVAYPSVTSVRTPRYEIGRTAIRLVQDHLSGLQSEARSVDLSFELIERESTRRR